MYGMIPGRDGDPVRFTYHIPRRHKIVCRALGPAL